MPAAFLSSGESGRFRTCAIQEAGMNGKRVRESSTLLAERTQPQDANPSGNVHGGVIMKHIDTAAGIAAMRHAGADVVTASIDRLDFYNPVLIGDVITLKASVNLTGRTSMEVGVRVEAENPITGSVRHTSSAYLTFVALDDDGVPMAVPPLIPETDEERRRHGEAQARRSVRLAERTREKSCRQNPDECVME